MHESYLTWNIYALEKCLKVFQEENLEEKMKKDERDVAHASNVIHNSLNINSEIIFRIIQYSENYNRKIKVY